MFKWESYLTPWLLGYLDKYVKLKPEDFELSLWGGDAVFNKLDLRLNVIEELTNIPITFKSGIIQQLHLHIPWTRLTSEPVVVTINTLEFVAKLKNNKKKSPKASSPSPAPSPVQSPPSSPLPSPSTSTTQTETIQSSVSKNQQQPPPPTGYIQNIINKIILNMQVIVNNVIIKFTEDDMVLSFNMKSAECFSVNELWEKTFVEVNAQNLNLRKIIQLNDVTICLDRLEKKTKDKNKWRVNFYQDPLIYRFSLQSRLHLEYSNHKLSTNIISQQLKLLKFNLYCRKFEVSITDQQIPMVIRLIELILAIKGDTLRVPDTNSNNDDNDDDQIIIKDGRTINLESISNIIQEHLVINDEQIDEDKSIELEKVTNDQKQEKQQQQQQGWLSWAWSYVPEILPTDEEINSNENDFNTASNNKLSKIKTTKHEKVEFELIIGAYFDDISLNFKVIK
jgi:vacuolar protein sorting-associated protein 13B